MGGRAMSGDARERLASRLGFILLSAGCAVGIGNVWRFPYVAGRAGGGWFVLCYLLFLAVLALPLLVMEFAAGRAAARSIATLHRQLTPERPLWRWHGYAGNAALILLMSFYTVVTGWMFLYFGKAAAGEFAGVTPAVAGEMFAAMSADPWRQAAAAAAVSVAAAAICAAGVRRGLERCTKIAMLALLALIAALAVRALFLPGAGAGVRFLLLPDNARLASVGVVAMLGEALQQAFFTLSLGIGSMAIFGSYIGRDRRLLGEGATVAALDTAVALLAGLLVMCACFAFGVEPAAGPRLVFVTLPGVFDRMAGGRLWGAMFFLFMGIAAFSTVMAVFEGIIAGFMEYTGRKRSTVAWTLGVLMSLAALPCVLGFNRWSGFAPFGSGTGILDLEDFLVSDLALPLGGLAFAFYCTRRCGWGWEAFLREANAGAGRRFPRWMRFHCAWTVPALIAAIVVLSLWRRFAGG